MNINPTTIHNNNPFSNFQSNDESSNGLIDINILRNHIKSAEEFLNNIIEENIISVNNIDDHNKKYFIKEFSVVKNFLTSLELSKILSFPFLNFDQTIYLNLTANELTFIPKEFNNLIKLETLILNNNKINKIENLENLSHLKRLELRNNKVKEFKGLENKQNIEILSLSCNLLEKIEEENFFEFPKLKEIGLFGNFLGDEKNLEENSKQLDKVLDLLLRKAGNLSSIYIGGNHFLHLTQAEIRRKIKEYKFKILSKLDGQNLD